MAQGADLRLQQRGGLFLAAGGEGRGVGSRWGGASGPWAADLRSAGQGDVKSGAGGGVTCEWLQVPLGRDRLRRLLAVRACVRACSLAATAAAAATGAKRAPLRSNQGG